MAEFFVKGPSGPVAVQVDAADLSLLQSRTWRLGANGYPCTDIWSTKRQRQDRVQMGRWLLGLQRGDPRQVDHRDGDPLNNRRGNLRVVTNAENAQNRRHAGGSSRHRGVCWNRQSQKWQAGAKLNGRSFHLGLFDNEEDAAAAASAFRREHMPFAREAA